MYSQRLLASSIFKNVTLLSTTNVRLQNIYNMRGPWDEYFRITAYNGYFEDFQLNLIDTLDDEQLRTFVSDKIENDAGEERNLILSWSPCVLPIPLA